MILRVSLTACLLAVLFVGAKGRPNYCFEKKCRCSNHTADCRYNDDKLWFIPKLPDGITSVDFSFNKVERIESAGFFENVTCIVSLEMVGTGLKYIAPGAFDKMERLQKLVISFNMLPSLPEATFSDATRQRLCHFDASQNPFNCDRRLVWLAEWMASRPEVFYEDKVDKYYECFSRDGSFLMLRYRAPCDDEKCRMKAKNKFYIVWLSKIYPPLSTPSLPEKEHDQQVRVVSSRRRDRINRVRN